MRRLYTIPIGFFLFFLTYGVFLSQFSINILPARIEPKNPKGFYDYSGVTNVHTTLSTGGGDFSKVTQAAQEVNLDYIFITDLNLFEKNTSTEGYYGNLMVFVDGEYSYLDARLLNYNSAFNPQLSGPGRAQVALTDLLSQRQKSENNGLLILAHPFKPGYSWSGNYPVGLDGLEVINLKSIWQKAWLSSKPSFLWTLLTYPFNPQLSLVRLFDIPEQEIELWDQLAQKRRAIGFAGSDAEAKVKILGRPVFNVPSYQTIFGIVRNHILLQSELTGNYANDRKKVASAIQNGQFYMSLDVLANPKGFVAYLQDPKSKITPIGGSTVWSEGLNLKVELPDTPLVPYEIVVYKDGEKMMTSNSISTEYTIPSAGVYRVVVRVIPTLPLPDGRKWIPWIFTNPFYVTGAEELAK